MDKVNLIDFSKYTISKDGTIFSKYYNRYLQGYLNKRGYVRVTLTCVDGKQRSYQWHRVIWYFFNGEIPLELEINHKDENKINNSLGNLELLSHTDNINYGTRTERAASKNSISQKGKHLSSETISKLRRNNAKGVLQYNIETNESIKEWNSVREAARELGFNQSSISKVCRGILSQTSGYGWKFT